jgi:ribulose 1,5-bisphosphate synthetase/thiazole synthase
MTVYGAGQAGMTDSINLARDGYGVVVHDREGGYGGSHGFEGPGKGPGGVSPLQTEL